MTDREGPPAEPHGVNPLELAHDAIENAYAMHQSDPLLARTTFRRRLEQIVRYMCPICGKTGDHEDAEHRFQAPHQRELHA